MAEKQEKEEFEEIDDESSINKVENNAAKMTNNAFEGVKNVAESAGSVIGNEINTAYEKTTEMFNSPNVLYGLIAVIIIALFCVGLVYYFIADTVFNKKSVIIEKTKFPIKGNVNSSILIDNFPASGNGLKKTYTFWLYIDNVNNASNATTHIFSIGPNTSNYTIKSCSPVVVLNNSKLYVHFPNETSTSAGLDLETIVTNVDDDSNNTYGTVYYDYLPMQRWVHIAIVISDDYRGATVSLYMDAELVKSITHNQDKENAMNKIYNLEKINLDISGNILIGGDGTSGIYGFNGLISKVGIHNYDLNSRDINNIYNEGPIDGLLASLGYGVRTPLYKLSE